MYSTHFIVESELTSSASPVLVFFSFFNEAILPWEIFFHWINVKTSNTDESWSESTFKIESLKFKTFILHFKINMTECYRRERSRRATLDTHYKSKGFIISFVSYYKLKVKTKWKVLNLKWKELILSIGIFN